MIKFEIDIEKGGVKTAEAKGELMQIVGELSMAVGELFLSLKQRDPLIAEAVKRIVQRSFEDGAPVWDYEAPGLRYIDVRKEGEKQ